MNTIELKNKLLEIERILQNAQIDPKREDVLKALNILNEITSSLEGVSS